MCECVNVRYKTREPRATPLSLQVPLWIQQGAPSLFRVSMPKKRDGGKATLKGVDNANIRAVKNELNTKLQMKTSDSSEVSNMLSMIYRLKLSLIAVQEHKDVGESVKETAKQIIYIGSIVEKTIVDTCAESRKRA